MGKIAAGERRTIDAGLTGGIEPVEVLTATIAATRRDTIGDILNSLANGHVELLCVEPLRGQSSQLGTAEGTMGTSRR